MYEMLTGQLPFRGKNKPAIQKAICSAKLKMPSFFTSEVVGLIKAWGQLRTKHSTDVKCPTPPPSYPSCLC
jgi:hypothetical protein